MTEGSCLRIRDSIDVTIKDGKNIILELCLAI